MNNIIPITVKHVDGPTFVLSKAIVQIWRVTASQTGGPIACMLQDYPSVIHAFGREGGK